MYVTLIYCSLCLLSINCNTFIYCCLAFIAFYIHSSHAFIAFYISQQLCFHCIKYLLLTCFHCILYISQQICFHCILCLLLICFHCIFIFTASMLSLHSLYFIAARFLSAFYILQLLCFECIWFTYSCITDNFGSTYYLIYFVWSVKQFEMCMF